MIGAVTDDLSQLYGGVFLCCMMVAFMVQPHLTQTPASRSQYSSSPFPLLSLKISPHSVILVKSVPRYTCISDELVYRFLNEEVCLNLSRNVKPKK